MANDVDVKPDEYAVENLYGYRDQPTVQAYLGTEAELMDYMDRVYGRTIDDPPSSIRIWERFGGNWVPHDKALREIVCGAARRTRRSYVLERDHDYPLSGQRWTAYCDDDEGCYSVEMQGMFTNRMNGLLRAFGDYLAERHEDAKRLRITVEEVE